MGWIAGTFLIGPGASVRVNFSWDGAWQGSQFALARPQTSGGWFLGRLPDHELETTNHGVGFTRRGEENPAWTYHVLVSNPHPSLFAFSELTGGEVQP